MTPHGGGFGEELVDISAVLTGYEKKFEILYSLRRVGLTELLGHLDRAPAPWDDRRFRAYLLATIRHECAGQWRPIGEFGSPAYFLKHYWENEHVRKQLGNVEVHDAIRYAGAGYVQITGRRNYKLFGTLLDLPLLETPRLALKPEVSFAIATIGMEKGLFTGRKLGEFITPTSCDYVNARRVINGVDHAPLISLYAQQFQEIL